jgi:hypothetical protein
MKNVNEGAETTDRSDFCETLKFRSGITCPYCEVDCHEEQPLTHVV